MCNKRIKWQIIKKTFPMYLMQRKRWREQKYGKKRKECKGNRGRKEKFTNKECSRRNQRKTNMSNK
jgi:hypothetical protein